MTLTGFSEFPLPFRLQLPEGWIEQSWTSDLRAPALGREFRPKNDPDAILNVWYRGRGVPSHTAEALRKLMPTGPSTLDSTQIASISEGFGNMAHPQLFELARAQTERIGGRTVVIVEGHWKEIDNDCYDIFVPVSADCSHLQEVYFVAPPDVYARQIESVKAALNTIVWG